MLRKRFVSMLSALALVLSMFALMPPGAFTADAYSGQGTQSDPYIVTTYEDLYYLLNKDSEEVYIKLGADINETDDKNYYTLDTYSNSMTCIYHVDLAGHSLKRTANTIDRTIFYVRKNTTLIMDDSVGGGSVVDNIAVSTGANDFSYLFYVDGGGHLIVNKGFYSQENIHKKLFMSVSSLIEIRGGIFSSKYDFFEMNTTDPCVTIDGGSFFSYAVEDSYGFVFKNKSPGFKIYNAHIYGVNTYFRLSNNYSPYPGIFNRFSEYTKVTVDGNEKSKETLQKTNYLKGTDIVISTPSAVHASLSVTEPKIGEKPQNAVVTASLGIRQGDALTSWYDLTDNKSVASDGTFIAGHKYRMNAVIGAEDGYVIGRLPAVNINYYSVKTTLSRIPDTDYFCNVFAEFECPKNKVVPTINVSLTKPKAGEVIDETMTSTTTGVYVSQGIGTSSVMNKGIWYHNGTKMRAGSKFAAGETYTAQFTIRVSTGYEFSEKPTVLANSKVAALKNAVSSSRTYTVDFTVPNAITKVELSGTVPAAGNTPAAFTVKSGNVTVATVWYHGSVKMADGEKFVAGEKYTASCMVTRKSSKEEFSNSVTVTLNGTAMQVTNVYSSYVLCQRTFTVGGVSVLIGDVNGDKKVNVKDLTALQRWINEWPIEIVEANADVNGDTKINVKDLTALQKLINSMPMG